MVLCFGFPLKASSASVSSNQKSGPGNLLWNLKYYDDTWRIFVRENGSFFILRKRI
jgi:hypothetical protein